MFGKKKVTNEEVKKDVIMATDDSISLNYYILFDRLAGVPIFSPFQAKNDNVALRSVASLLVDPKFHFKPQEIALYHIFKMSESTLDVVQDKYFVCYCDEVADRLDKIQGEL